MKNKFLAPKTRAWIALTLSVCVPSNGLTAMYKGVYGSPQAQPLETMAVDVGDIDGDGVHTASPRLPTDGTRTLFYLDNRPFRRITGITVDGAALASRDGSLTPNYCYNAASGWISFRQTYTSANVVIVTYEWSDALDIVSANNQYAYTDSLMLYKNQGGFNFTQTSPTGFTYTGHGVAVGDFNAQGGDGKADVLLGCTSTGTVVFSGDGAGAFPSKIMPDGAARDTSHVAWGDVDGDGWLDYGEANGDGGASAPGKVFRNKSGGGFEELWSNTASKWSGFDFGDVNNDGALDFAIANDNTDKLEVWRNDPTSEKIIGAVGGGTGCSANSGIGYAFDANDLTAQNVAGSNIYELRSAAADRQFVFGTVSVQPGVSRAKLLKFTTPTSYTAVDIPAVASNNPVTATGVAVDDNYVYVLAGYAGNIYRLFKYDKNLVKVLGPVGLTTGYSIGLSFDPTFTYLYTACVAGNKIIKIRASDLGTQATLSVSAAPRGVAVDGDFVYYTTGDMWNNIRKTPIDFSGVGETSTTMPGTACQAICVKGNYIYVSNFVCGPAKIEKRNKSDLSYVTENSTAFVETLSCNPDSLTHSRTFTRVWQSPTVLPSKDVKWADMDRDGKLDLVVANNGVANEIFYNDGVSGGIQQFSAPWTQPVVTLGHGVAVDDFNADGKLDLAFANGGAPSYPAATIYLNQGINAGDRNNFSYAWGSDEDVPDFNAFETGDIRSADMNKDGKPDLILSAKTTGNTYSGVVVYSQPVVTGRKLIRVKSVSNEGGKKTTIITTYTVNDDGTLGRVMKTEVK